MSKVVNLTYTGTIKAVVASDKTIAFVTQHDEGKPTGLYRIDGESNKLTKTALPCGGISLLKTDSQYWIGGDDGLLYAVGVKDKAATALKTNLPASVTAMVSLSDSRIALLAGKAVIVVDAKAKPIQTIELSENGTAIASNPNGTWLAIGTSKGNVSVYQCEDQDDWTLSESEALHEGSVTSLLFEPEELRFFSAGTGNKLLVTHARGRLEAEDRGRSNNHSKAVSSMILAEDDRIVTGSLDKSCKSWVRGNATKPSSLTDGIVAVTGLAAVTIHKRTNLVVACNDQSLRLFLLEDGRPGKATVRYNDGYVRAAGLFESRESSDRGQAMQELAELDDRKAFQMLNNRVTEDPDNKLRLIAAKLVTNLSFPQLEDQLALHLNHVDAPVRMLALEALEKLKAEGHVELFRSAITTNHSEIGTHSVQALVKLAKKKGCSVAQRNEVLAVLRSALDSESVEIRNSTVFGLEEMFEKKSPRPNLLALNSHHDDSKRKGLIRMLHRGLLGDSNTIAGLRRAVEDKSPDVRQTALLVSVLSRPKLSEALRTRDKTLDRQLSELETFQFEDDGAKPKKGAVKKPAKKNPTKVKLDFEDDEPLLVAISSRAVDTCLLGAKCLALLEDPRAFGILMQLSRENDPQVRLETCRSFAKLGDSRAVDRLCTLLVDTDVKVRDAAYSALEEVSGDQPLVAAEHGLASSFEDIRRRGLESLIRFSKKAKLKNPEGPAGQLLQQALSDSIASVRMEAFKFALNAKIDGGNDKTLRFLLNSVEADVRREVLNEVMAEKAQPWSEGMMLELLSDADESIRSDAFKHLQKKYDKDQTQWLAEAVGSKHVDIRKQACQTLIKIGNSAAQDVLALSINDQDSEVRELALKSLIAKGATGSLVTALDSSFVGVQLAAAKALAQNGDPRCKEVLLSIASQDRPDTEPDQELWENSVCEAINGLLMLGDNETVEFLVKLCGNANEEIRQHAAAALKATANAQSFDLIKPLLKHEDDHVRMPAAMAVALHGNMIAGRLILSSEGESPIDNEDRLLTAVALGEDAENQLVQMLDVKDIALANSALIVLLCRDWLQHAGSPRRIVSALAARDARIRLIAAEALQSFSESKKLAAVISDVFNDRADSDDFQVAPDVIRSIAEIVVFSKPHVQSRAVMLLSNLNDAKQSKWDFGWEWFTNRFGADLELAANQAESQPLPKIEMNQETLDQLAFGTYVGLSREQGGFHFRKYWARFGWSVETVRLAAIRRLAAMANDIRELVSPTISVMTHACSGPWASVRELAFGALKELGVNDESRAQIGIATGQFDLAVAGLGLLTASASAAKRREILTDAILNQPSSIAYEAANMLRQDVGSVKTAEVCMNSSNEAVKRSAVVWLAEDSENDSAAKKVLRSLAADAPVTVKHVAIEQLVTQRDDQAFDSIANVLKSANPKIKRSLCYRWLLQLHDERTPAFLLDLLKQYKSDLNAGELLGVVGQLRDPKTGDRLLQLLEEKDVVADAVKALKMVSGFDQRIQDPNDLRPHDRRWMDKQHPRHGDLLARLTDRTIELGLTNHAKGLIASARWCLTGEVDSPLGRLCTSPDEPTRHQAIGAVSFRAEKRDASVDVLKSIVSHRDPMTQFLASEGLAKAGHDDGLQVLMSAVEMMDDLRLRQRAVLAIGHLADERGLDLLLKLVTHDAHALQDSAAEAIGYLGNSSQKEKIFRILNKLVAQEGTAGARAIIGLRHMNTPEAWDVIRSKAKTTSQSLSGAVVIDQLGYDDSPATQDLLVDLLERYPNYLQVQLTSARRSFGADSIVPDIAFLKGRSGNRGRLSALEVGSLNRVCDSATAREIFELTNRCPDQARSRLADHLLMQDQLPLKEAVANLESEFSPTVELAARMVGRSGDKKFAKLVGSVLSRKVDAYCTESERLLRQNEAEPDPFQQDKNTLLVLVWAAGRVSGSEKLLLDIVIGNASNIHFTKLRAAALHGLAGAKLSAAMQTQLRELLDDYDPAIRMAAADLLARQAKSKPNEIGEALMADRFAFDSLAGNGALKLDSVMQKATASTHYQPRSLLKMAKSKDLKTLVAVVEDESLDINSRLGAIEGLSKMVDAKSEKVLLNIGKSADLEELRKAAWRGLRRSKRAGAKS